MKRDAKVVRTKTTEPMKIIAVKSLLFLLVIVI